MTTRAKKHIRGSFHESDTNADVEIVTRSERKTRNKSCKENYDDVNTVVPKGRKRNNYVAYPTDDEEIDDSKIASCKSYKNSHVLQRATLKDRNIDLLTSETMMQSSPSDELKKTLRCTRRTKKNIDNLPEQQPRVENDLNTKKKTKMGKKKKNRKNKKISEIDMVSQEKSVENTLLNISSIFSNISKDSFHSAAGSPVNIKYADHFNEERPIEILLEESFKTDMSVNSFEANLDNCKNITKEMCEKNNSKDFKFIGACIENGKSWATVNSSDKESKNTRFLRSNKQIDRISFTDSNNYSSVTIKKQNSYIKNTCDDKDETTHFNTNILDVSTERKRLRLSKEKSFDVIIDTTESSRTNNIYNEAGQGLLNTKYEKDNEIKLDTTFERTDIKSSTTAILINSSDSTDGTRNATFDKSPTNCNISHETNNENLLNSTPLLIESSMDDSSLSKDLKKSSLKSESPVECKGESPIMPLKREGTFTKDGPDPIIITKSNVSVEKTPTKRLSLPSPGRTPFHSNTKSSQKEKSIIMNVTRSIEKSARRSSVAELLPRATRVMFCSPVDNPTIFTQRKSKIVKSSLKGSNKSFVFDENVSSPVRPAGRKRSFTQNDADDVRTKRKRLDDDMQKSVDRLSRPRTPIVSDRNMDPVTTTPSKSMPKLLSKSESKVNRTKMPNFATLHQKRFAKMESLDECQERKAKRAKQMMTPVGSLTVLERSSPKVSDSPKVKNNLETQKIKILAASDSPKVKNKSETPLKPKLPTLDSLRPGFTRFGFKLNTDYNPFIFTNKTEQKPKGDKPNGVLKRQPTLPSLAGTTSNRKDVAKHAVMREKSFTSLKRDVNRKECRTIIKGVRTNRRFELQMKCRDINN